MAYETGRKALENENVLLKELHGVVVVASKQPLDPVTARIFKGWEGSFEKLQGLNRQLIDGDDQNFIDTLEKEEKLLVRLSDEANKNGGFAGSWVELFNEDVEIVGLLKQ